MFLRREDGSHTAGGQLQKAPDSLEGEKMREAHFEWGDKVIIDILRHLCLTLSPALAVWIMKAMFDPFRLICKFL